MCGSKQTGIGNYIKNLIEGLIKIDREDEFVVFLSKDNFDQLDLSGAPNFKKVKVDYHWYTWKEQVFMPWVLRREKLDLMHFTHFNTLLLYQKPFIATIHDVTPLYFPGHKMNSFVRRMGSKLAFLNSSKMSRHIIAVSNFTKNQIIKNFSVSEKKISTVYEGVDNSFQKEINYDKIKEIKEKYAITKPYIFFIGVWRNHKNAAGLIKAFNILKKKHKQDIQLVLGGKEDPYYPEVRKTWEKLGLEKDIVRPGFVKEDELQAFFKGASVLARPSFIEGFTLVEFEAMSQGVPVAASNSSCIPEILGDAAAYFDPLDPEDMADVLNQVLVDDKLRKDLIKKGYERLKEFSWEKCAQETLQVYKNENKSR